MTCTLLTTVQISQILVLSQNLKQTNVCIIQVNVCDKRKVKDIMVTMATQLTKLIDMCPHSKDKKVLL
jgi:glutamate formiminotransferase